MFHCYYCNHILQFVPKFKPQDRDSQGPHGHLSRQEAICQTCKAIYLISIEIVRPTPMRVEVLEEYRNRPLK